MNEIAGLDDLAARLSPCNGCRGGEKTDMPDAAAVIEILLGLQALLFPGCHGGGRPCADKLKSVLGELSEKLIEQCARAYCHVDVSLSREDGREKGVSAVTALFGELPKIRQMLTDDIRAAYEGDPAARSQLEVVMSYPGLTAIAVQRIAHCLYRAGVPLIPRVMSEWAHSRTGIDIHPGASIGEGFFIDHGTGVVIGETCVIGRNVKIYQGVTLGALSFQKEEDGTLVKGVKRHPNVEDNVVIYAGATILGGGTVIGHDSVIGGNVWLIHSVPPCTTVYNQTPKPIMLTNRVNTKS